jgi:hypothetical protein
MFKRLEKKSCNEILNTLCHLDLFPVSRNFIAGPLDIIHLATKFSFHPQVKLLLSPLEGANSNPSPQDASISSSRKVVTFFEH